MNYENDEMEIDLLELFFLLKRKLFILLAAALLGAALFGGYSKFLIQPLYRSTSELYILTQSTSITSLADIQMGTSLTQDYKELIKSRPVVEQVIENLSLPHSYEQLVRAVSIENPASTRVIKIVAEEGDPQMAKDIADEFADVARVSISNIMATAAPNVVQYGHVDTKPISPNVSRNAALGGLLGLFAASAIVIVLHLLDDTIKTSEDVEKKLGLTTLAEIPLMSGQGASHGKAAARKEKEA